MELSYLTLAHAPKMYGPFHLLFVFSVFCLAFLIGHKSRDMKEEKRDHLIFGIALCMLLFEGIKQYDLTFKIHQGTYDWFHFPFQLCSMPMYLGVLLPLFKEEGKKTIHAFLLCFGLFGAVCAYLYPQDMLSRDVFLLLHSFIYHACMVFLSMLCGSGRRLSWKDFAHACILFLFLAGIAEGINVLVHTAGHDTDMFYIEPYTVTTQPVFHTIALVCGIPFEIILYLCLILLANTGIFALYRIFGKGDFHA